MKHDKHTELALECGDQTLFLHNLLGALKEHDAEWLEQVSAEFCEDFRLTELDIDTDQYEVFGDEDMEPFGQEAWENEDSFSSAGMGMDESYEW